ncbi:hypothetical protein M9H77_02007 [Catharanthus roseus]|uniref:Uncharacterized protein n=1 Tax=Catharanthus roseus TaxID=4058 RepID=A0ACC0C756_CATRO|nr:hypothetical protein M9H77_02007 [Catharanthus roseus]
MKDLVSRVWIGIGDNKDFLHQITYEDLPSYCTNCMRLGHATLACKNLTVKVPTILASKDSTAAAESNQIQEKIAFISSVFDITTVANSSTIGITTAAVEVPTSKNVTWVMKENINQNSREVSNVVTKQQELNQVQEKKAADTFAVDITIVADFSVVGIITAAVEVMDYVHSMHLENTQ